jgi:hypothetical protein
MRTLRIVTSALLLVAGCRTVERTRFDKEIDRKAAALGRIEEDYIRGQERAKGAEAEKARQQAEKAQQEKEQFENDLRQLKQETADFLAKYSNKPLSGLTVFEIAKLLDNWQDLQWRWVCSTGTTIPQRGEFKKVTTQDGRVTWQRPFDGTFIPEILPPWARELFWGDSPDFPRIDFISRETFYVVFGMPQRVQTRPGGQFCYWLLYACDGNTLQIAAWVFENEHQKDPYTVILVEDFSIY